MKVSCMLAATAALFLLAGCQEGTPGGPGATTDDSTVTSDPTAASPEMPSPSTAPADSTAPPPDTNVADTSADDSENSFTLDAPNLTTNLKQGEQQIVSIGISRGSKFQQDVTLSFENLPPGVTVEPAQPVIKVGDKEAKVTFKASADAALNDHEIKIVGHPATGKDAMNTLNLSISKP